MHTGKLNYLVLSFALFGHAGFCTAELGMRSFNSEVISTVIYWEPGSGSITINGTRYPVSEDAQVVSRSGDAIDPSNVRKGSNVGILEENGTVTKIIVFDK